MKPGAGIDPSNYTGASDSEYFKKQFTKHQKESAKKAAKKAAAAGESTAPTGTRMKIARLHV
jgi:hypothetical protein